LHRCGKTDIERTLAAVGEIESHFVLAVAPTSSDESPLAAKLASGATILRSDSHSQSAHNDILVVAANLYSGGVPLNLSNMFSDQRRKKIDLPGYPLNKKRYWITEIADHSQPTPTEN
jgi:acyl transferase domain-containing protein